METTQPLKLGAQCAHVCLVPSERQDVVLLVGCLGILGNINSSIPDGSKVGSFNRVPYQPTNQTARVSDAGRNSVYWCLQNDTFSISLSLSLSDRSLYSIMYIFSSSQVRCCIIVLI